MDWDGENPVSISFLLADDAVSALAKLSKKDLVVRFRDVLLRGENCGWFLVLGVLTASILPFMVAEANVSALAIRSKKEELVIPLGVAFLGDCCTFPFIVADAYVSAWAIRSKNPLVVLFLDGVDLGVRDNFPFMVAEAKVSVNAIRSKKEGSVRPRLTLLLLGVEGALRDLSFIRREA